MRSLSLSICAVVLAAVVARSGGAAGPQLAGAHPCPGQAGLTCSTLTVSLDWSGRTPGSLRLAVAAAPAGPSQTLLVLTGGPGQPGVPFISKVASRLGSIAKRYRLVMVDQRGTGTSALDCPRLQREMGYSDLRPPTPAAVRACAAKIGPKRVFFGTDDTVRDLDRLRQALGVGRLSIDGISYGTYTAERYALAYPSHVSRLVLDSDVPQFASGQLETQAFPRVAQVLRNVCGRCADDLASDVHRDHDGPALLDLVVGRSVIDPTYSGIAHALRDPASLRKVLGELQLGEASTRASDLSQGLHASTLCEDWRWPWGDSSAPLAGRAAALRSYADSLPERALGPFDRATVTGNGIMQQCLYWPPTPPTPQPPANARITAPTLILAGNRDLSTPLSWPRAELKLLPHGKLVIVPRMGHSTQRDPKAIAAVRAFLLGG
jgi:pimeloyl-ACP methyl ester carboxylesterase